LVYEIYGLMEEEIRIVEGVKSERHRAQGNYIPGGLTPTGTQYGF
jgi:hypothetical protein